MGKKAKTYLIVASLFVSMASPLAMSASAPVAPQVSDTTVRSATKMLIESLGELSRTANKLSEATIKLLEIEDVVPASGTKDDTAPILEDSIPEAQSELTVSDSNRFMPGDSLEGGKYIWIPEDRREAVEMLLAEKAVPVVGEDPDLNEKTYWRGDSIPMALHTKRLGRFDRKLYNWLIYPIGRWQISLTASYGELSTQDWEFLSVLDDMDISGKSYSVKPAFGYFLRSNLCMGLRFAYSRGEAAINTLNVDIDDDMNFGLHDIDFTSENYTASVFVQQYFGLSRRGRFAVFNEAELAFGSGNRYFTRPYGDRIRQTRSRTQSVNLSYSPGVSILIMKNAAFNLSFGVLGFHLTNEKQWEDGEKSGSRLTSGINFRLNIFNINFGVSIMI